MTKKYANELGKCYAKTNDGRFRAYKDGGLFRIYLCGREMKFDSDYNFVGYGKRIEAVGSDVHFKNIENFDAAVYEVECELNYLMKAGA
jgi:hypothetical protein